MLEGVSFFSLEAVPSSLSTGTKEADIICEKVLSSIFMRNNTWTSSSRLWGPVLGVLILAKALIVVTLSGEELLEVGLAIENSLHGRVISEGEVTFAV
jgi:hypothetical protein